MRRKNYLIAAAAAAWSACASAQAGTLEQDAIAFGTRETTTGMDLSPDGARAVFLGAGPGKTTIVYLADLAAGTSKPILYSKADPEALRWCAFASSDRIVCRFTAIMKSEVTRLATNSGLISASRMISVSLDGKDIKQLGQPSSQSDVGLRQNDGTIIDWLPDANNEVLMTRLFLPEGHRDVPSNVQRTKRGVGVVRLNVKTLGYTLVEQPRSSVWTWMSDGRGRVRLLGTAQLSAETFTTGRVKFAYRPASSRDWKELTDYVDTEDFSPLAVDASVDSLYALRKRNGRMALTRIELGAAPIETLVAENPKVDIDNVVRSANGQRVIGYTYVEDYRHTVYFDPEYKALSAALTNALPGHPVVDFVTSTKDGSKLLIFAGADRDPGRYYLFDKARKSLAEIMPVRPNLASRALAEVKPIAYRGPDGTSVPAYLTLPVGKEAKGLPAIVMPHGGPSARDEWGFDWLAQFLAARGYAVIQPNFRGSAGYGEAWLNENGFKNWQTSIGDVNAAARYLASAGIADPKRTAIVGWSYGGYAALQSAAIEPNLYQAVVAIAPVTDLALLKTAYEDTTGSKEAAEFIGSDRLAQASPLRHASSIQAPVLLVHGDMDLNVGFIHSQRMADALRSAGKETELLTFAGLDHQLADNNARAKLLVKIGQLLDRTIGH